MKCQPPDTLQWPIYIFNSVVNTKLPAYVPGRLGLAALSFCCSMSAPGWTTNKLIKDYYSEFYQVFLRKKNCFEHFWWPALRRPSVQILPNFNWVHSLHFFYIQNVLSPMKSLVIPLIQVATLYANKGSLSRNYVHSGWYGAWKKSAALQICVSCTIAVVICH